METVAEVDNVNTEIRIYIIVFTAIEIIIHQTSAMTSSINPSELRLLILLYIYFRCYPSIVVSTVKIYQTNYEYFSATAHASSQLILS